MFENIKESDLQNAESWSRVDPSPIGDTVSIQNAIAQAEQLKQKERRKMFEVGRRYRRVEKADSSIWEEGDTAVFMCQAVPFDKDGGIFVNQNGRHFGYYKYFDPTPIDDAPAPRMVTTPDIGARAVRGRDWDYSENEYQGGKNPIGTITGYLAGIKMVEVKWDNGRSNSYEIGDGGKYDLYYADEQPKKEAEYECERCGKRAPNVHFCVPKGITDAFKKASQAMVDLGKSIETETKDDEGTDKNPPDPAPGIASVMFGSKPRLMYGSLMQIQGPTKDEEARNVRTEEERKRYDQG